MEIVYLVLFVCCAAGAGTGYYSQVENTHKGLARRTRNVLGRVVGLNGLPNGQGEK